MVIGVNCGHTIKGAGSGAIGIMKESEHTRLVGQALMKQLKSVGIDVVDCTIDTAESRQEYLGAVVTLANKQELDWFISIHFNASTNHMGHGVEVYTYKGRQYTEALDICASIAKLGLTNRGVKAGSDLYVIRKTKAKSLLIEVCFCDNAKDVETYMYTGAENSIAQAIFNSIQKQVKKSDDPLTKIHNISFIEFVGETAKKDWQKRRIMLPSVVVAQALKESAWGTSELAKKANALFGIKKNGWTGKIYIKTATEQKPDGSYYIVDNTQWRAYDNWEESIIDHNTYIATRSTDGGKTLRYQQVIGCDDYTLVCRYLQTCGYATSHSYADSLVNDYIQKYQLTQFDIL